MSFGSGWRVATGNPSTVRATSEDQTLCQIHVGGKDTWYQVLSQVNYRTNGSTCTDFPSIFIGLFLFERIDVCSAFGISRILEFSPHGTELLTFHSFPHLSVWIKVTDFKGKVGTRNRSTETIPMIVVVSCEQLIYCVNH